MSDTPTQAPYLSIPQVADSLNCSPDTVRRLIARGELRAVRFGRLIRIAVGELARAGRPVTALARTREISAIADDERATSGRRPGETWHEWSARLTAS